MKNCNLKIFLLSMVLMVHYFVGCSANASKISKPHNGYLYEKPKSVFEEKRIHSIQPEEAIEEEEKEMNEIEREREEEKVENEIERERENEEESVQRDEEEDHSRSVDDHPHHHSHHHPHHHHHHHSPREYLLPKDKSHHIKGEDTEDEKNLKKRSHLNDCGKIHK